MHDGQLLRGVLVLLLVLGRLPPAAGSAELLRVVDVPDGVLVVVLVHGFEVGEALPEHGEGHVVISGVRIALVCRSDIIPPGFCFPWNACMGPRSIPKSIFEIFKSILGVFVFNFL